MAAPALAGASAVLDLDRLLWVPGEKTIFLPPVVPIRAVCSQFLTTDWVAREALKLLQKQLVVSRIVAQGHPVVCPESP